MTTAIAFTGVDRVEVRQETDVPPGPGEFTVASTVSLISSGTEGICLGRRFEAGTHWDEWVRYPFAPGYSLVGVVAELGPGTTRVSLGDRVAVRKPHRGRVVVTADDDVYPIPDEVDDLAASWFHLATIAQVGVRRAAHRLGDRVAVVGLGPVGQLVVRYVRAAGAAEVIAVDPIVHRVELARAGGATVGLAMGVTEAVEAIREHCGGVDVLYDVTGAAPVLGQALGALDRFGRLVLLGDTGSPSAQHLSKHVIVEGLTIVGAHDMHGEHPASAHAPWNNPRMGELFFRYLARGDLRVAELVSHRFPAHRAGEAYELVSRRDPAAMGIAFDWS
ncbi:zinc-binding alcohol dehydrogenase [Dactylosporangium siamense]|uniref:Uncharacterized protein n=1 Tax=Dactylosporangium siamense TaxID=685454 RepID=A0A919PNG4_9ACTN|nr:zinc-binding alcohol dehydrogenase [Dactylosporangium siamense]GIG47985.1 hypothetical protein Dsi01nite_060260 [Dactylosporangium siamense]